MRTLNDDTSEVVGGSTRAGVAKALLDEAAPKLPAANAAMPRTALRRENRGSESLIFGSKIGPKNLEGGFFA